MFMFIYKTKFIILGSSFMFFRDSIVLCQIRLKNLLIAPVCVKASRFYLSKYDCSKFSSGLKVLNFKDRKPATLVPLCPPVSP